MIVTNRMDWALVTQETLPIAQGIEATAEAMWTGEGDGTSTGWGLSLARGCVP